MPYDKIFLAFFFRLINEAKKYFKKSILITLTKFFLSHDNCCRFYRNITTNPYDNFFFLFFVNPYDKW